MHLLLVLGSMQAFEYAVRYNQKMLLRMLGHSGLSECICMMSWVYYIRKEFNYKSF